MALNFITSVNKWGLPHRWYPKHSAEAPSGIVGLSPEECARWYWMLDGIHFRYRYRVNDEVCERDFVAHVITAPQFRGAEVQPRLWYQAQQGPDTDGAPAYWNDINVFFSKIHTMPGGNRAWWPVEFFESGRYFALDSQGAFPRTLAAYRYQVAPFDITFYLGSDDDECTGAIDYFSLTPVFFPKTYWETASAVWTPELLEWTSQRAPERWRGLDGI